MAAEPGDVRRETLVAVLRDEGPRVLATLVRTTGSLGVAEDAVQDAAVRALETWPRTGVPANPGGWLLVTARNRAVDLLRREAARTAKETAAVSAYGPFTAPSPETLVDEELLRDDLLRLLFTCSHPALGMDARVALSLRLLCGLTTAEVARALLLPEATLAKRLTRAKRKIAAAAIPYRIPDADDLPARTAAVLATVYLLFNEGYAATGGDRLVRVELVEEALRLSLLLHDLLPDDPSVTGLRALLLLTDARRSARIDDAGVPVLLPDQDRSRWDRVKIRDGVMLVGAGLQRTPVTPDRYVVQAAIAACHALAPS